MILISYKNSRYYTIYKSFLELNPSAALLLFAICFLLAIVFILSFFIFPGFWIMQTFSSQGKRVDLTNQWEIRCRIDVEPWFVKACGSWPLVQRQRVGTAVTLFLHNSISGMELIIMKYLLGQWLQNLWKFHTEPWLQTDENSSIKKMIDNDKIMNESSQKMKNKSIHRSVHPTKLFSCYYCYIYDLSSLAGEKPSIWKKPWIILWPLLPPRDHLFLLTTLLSSLL